MYLVNWLICYVQDQAGCTSPTEDLEAAILQVLRATKDLKQEVKYPPPHF